MWAETARSLIQKGHQVRICVEYWPRVPPKLQKLIEMGADLYFRKPTPIPSIAQRVASKIARYFKPQETLDPIDRWIRAKEPDLVFISMGNYLEDPGWMQYCQRRRLPYAIVPHVVGEHAFPDDRSSLMWAGLYEGAKMTFCVCERGVENLRRQMATPLPRTKVIRNPVNVRRDASVPWPDDIDTRVAMVGRLDSFCKGQDIAIEILAKPKWRDRKLHLSIYGTGPYEKTLKLQAQMHGLNNVSFEGFASDVEAIWAKHHALLLPSRVEGLPLVVVEAMMMARPCIVTDVHGDAELIDDNTTGFVAAAAVPRYFDEAMERAWGRRAEWRAMGQRARDSILAAIPDDPGSVMADELLVLAQ